MAYAKGVLAGVTAIIGVLVVPGLIRIFFGGPQKATGLAVVRAGLFEALLSPLFWTEALCVFGLLFLASRLSSKALRVLLFWAPAITITTVGCAFVGLLTFVFFRYKS